MKWMTFVLSAALVVGVVGCGEGEKGTVKGKDGKVLTVSPPNSVSVTQGGSETFKIGIKREKFDDEVSLTFVDLPKGVTIKESSTKVPKGATEATFTLEAKDDATAVENAQTKVTAKGGDMSTEGKFTVNVKKK